MAGSRSCAIPPRNRLARSPFVPLATISLLSFFKTSRNGGRRASIVFLSFSLIFSLSYRNELIVWSSMTGLSIFLLNILTNCHCSLKQKQIRMSNSHLEICSIDALFSKVTRVNHKITFPTPRAHTMALLLACRMSKPELVTPIWHSPGVQLMPSHLNMFGRFSRCFNTVSFSKILKRFGHSFLRQSAPILCLMDATSIDSLGCQNRLIWISLESVKSSYIFQLINHFQLRQTINL